MADETHAAEKIVSRLGGLRDGLLVVGALFYGLGYVSWSIIALARNISTVPALDAQYLVAGAPIAIILLGAIGAMRLIASVSPRHVRKYYSNLPPITKRVAALMLVVAIVAPLTRCGYVVARPTLLRQFDIAIGCVPLVALLIAGALRIRTARINGWNIGLLLQIAGSVVLLSFITTVFYICVIYPQLPSVLGGGDVKRVMVDLKADAFSADTLRDLGATAAYGHGVFRSRELLLLGRTPDTLFVTASQDARDDFTCIELPREHVLAVVVPPQTERPASPQRR